MRRGRGALASAVLGAWAALGAAQAGAGAPAGGAPPALALRDLAGAAANLDAVAVGAPCALICGFSRASSDPCQRLEDLLWSRYPAGSACRVVAVLELQEAPGFVVPFIRSGVRSKTPRERWGRVLIDRGGESALKAWIGYDPKDPDDTYAAVLDARGRPLWRGHARGAPALLAAMRGLPRPAQSPSSPNLR